MAEVEALTVLMASLSLKATAPHTPSSLEMQPSLVDLMASLSLTETADSGDEITTLSASCISSVSPCNTLPHPLNLHGRRENIIFVTSPYHPLICSVFVYTNTTRPSTILTQKDFYHELKSKIHISSLFFQSSTLPLHSFSPTKTNGPLFSQTKWRGYNLRIQIDISFELDLQLSPESFIVIGEDNCTHRQVAVTHKWIFSKSKKEKSEEQPEKQPEKMKPRLTAWQYRRAMGELQNQKLTVAGQSVAATKESTEELQHPKSLADESDRLAAHSKETAEPMNVEREKVNIVPTELTGGPSENVQLFVFQANQPLQHRGPPKKCHIISYSGWMISVDSNASRVQGSPVAVEKRVAANSSQGIVALEGADEEANGVEIMGPQKESRQIEDSGSNQRLLAGNAQMAGTSKVSNGINGQAEAMPDDDQMALGEKHQDTTGSQQRGPKRARPEPSSEV